MSALEANSAGSYNTAVGYDALSSNTSGHRNTAVGYFTLLANDKGFENTAIGLNALTYNTWGWANTAVGVRALFSNTTGQYNTATGHEALKYNLTGLYNTANGWGALFSNTTGQKNTAVGEYALFSSSGNSNIAIGAQAGWYLKSGDNNIYLGNPGATTESNTMRLGTPYDPSDRTGQTSTFIAGITGTVIGTGSTVVINNLGQLGIHPSSARYKRDIEPMGARSHAILKLRPVTFRYKQDVQGERQYGFSAEEVAKVYPELVMRDASGAIESVRYQEVIPMLLNELQYQQRQLAELQAQNARLRAAVQQQQARDAALAARLDRLEEAATRATTLASR
jgi:hypothetical protein